MPIIVDIKERARMANELAPKILEATDGALIDVGISAVLKVLAYLIYVQHGPDDAERCGEAAKKMIKDYLRKPELFDDLPEVETVEERRMQ